ncbi:MAG: hypothetical protein AAF907_03205, partial [Planctomycetota bacterium]
RRAAAELFAEVDAALAAKRFDRARDLLAHAFRVIGSDEQRREPRYAAYGDAGAWGDANSAETTVLNDSAGRSWFSAPGRTDGYARAWSFDGYQGESREAVACNLVAVLDDLCRTDRGPVISDRLHEETVAAIRPGTLTALTASDPAASLAMICDRVADALERSDRGAVTVLLRDAAPGAFVTMLLAHLTARLNGGIGLNAGEVDARLAGRDAERQYATKPWLADEAADRLRTHGDRLRIVDARGAAFGEALHSLTRTGAVHAAGSQADGSAVLPGGVLCDAADAEDLSRLAEFAAETHCWALAATAPRTPVEHLEPTWHAADARGAWQPERPIKPRSVEGTARLTRFRDLVSEWITRASA